MKPEDMILGKFNATIANLLRESLKVANLEPEVAEQAISNAQEDILQLSSFLSDTVKNARSTMKKIRDISKNVENLKSSADAKDK